MDEDIRPTLMCSSSVISFRSVGRCTDYLSSREVAHNLFFSRAQPLRITGEIQSEDRRNALPLLVTAYIFPRASVVGALFIYLFLNITVLK